MGLRYAPMAFTEHGVLMLSSVLNSEKQSKPTFKLGKYFQKIRQMLADTNETRLDVETIKKKIEKQGKNIELVFQYLDELIDKKEASA